MIKMCIISGAEDRLLSRFIESLTFIKQDVQVYILRNKPTNVVIPKGSNITMKMVENANYRKNGQIQLLKLRYESVLMADPKEGDIIMLLDDDAWFEKTVNFTEVIDLLENKGVKFIVGKDIPAPLPYDACRTTGIFRGHFFKYNPVVWEKVGLYKEFYGGGEDGVIAALNYKYGGGACIQTTILGVNHVGKNSWFYMPDRADVNSCVWLLNGHPEFSMNIFDREIMQLFNKLQGSLTPPIPKTVVI